MVLAVGGMGDMPVAEVIVLTIGWIGLDLEVLMVLRADCKSNCK